MEKKKILYIMGIDWNWIYQRPQLIAEKLNADFDVTVIFPRSITRFRKGAAKEAAALNRRILWTIPFQEKNRLIGFLAEKLQQRLFKDCHKYDCVYIGYPLYARYLPKDYEGKVIYDCMDNHEALYPDRKRVAHIFDVEKRLSKECDSLIVSSALLQEKMNGICGEQKAVLVRNGVKIEQLCPVKPACIKDAYKIGYIGTIAEWFDRELLRNSVEKNSVLVYHLMGPGGETYQSLHERIIWEGIIPHADLPEKLKGYDCLVMPFVVNDIILSVDPVKLYEYIALGKSVVSIYYPELAHFKDYVYFYETEEEYHALMSALCEKGFPPKYSEEMQRAFIKENSWEARYETVKAVIAEGT